MESGWGRLAPGAADCPGREGTKTGQTGTFRMGTPYGSPILLLVVYGTIYADHHPGVVVFPGSFGLKAGERPLPRRLILDPRANGEKTVESSPRPTETDARWVRREEVAKRLKTVEGQLRAVRRMVLEGDDCLDIATQAAAALEGLRGAMKIVLRIYMDDCLDVESLECDREAAYDQFVRVVERFIR